MGHFAGAEGVEVDTLRENCGMFTFLIHAQWLKGYLAFTYLIKNQFKV